MPAARERLIVALDVPNRTEAQKILCALGSLVSTFKVGKQLFTAEGPALVRELVSAGRQVFLDLKFHDIPNTVAAAVQSAAKLEVSMLTVHASGGAKMLQRAVEAAAGVARPPKVLAVTVLTSLTDADLRQIGIAGGALEQALRLARLAKASGCDGVVASPAEAQELRRELGEGFLIVTPGVRPAGAEKEKQAQVATASEALRAGATHIVVGRPIIAAADPAAAAREILREMEGISGGELSAGRSRSAADNYSFS